MTKLKKPERSFVGFYCEPELQKKLQEMAKEESRSVASQAKFIIKDFIERRAA